MKIIINTDSHIIQLQLKDSAQVTLSHIVQIINHNLAPQFHPNRYQYQNHYFISSQLPHTLASLWPNKDQVTLNAKRSLEQKQGDDLSKGFQSITLDSSLLTIESIALSPRAYETMMKELCPDTDNYPSEKAATLIPPFFIGLTHFILPHGKGFVGMKYYSRLSFLLKRIKETPSLKYFYFTESSFDNEDARRFADILNGNKTIRHLGLPIGHIGSEGAASLINSLKALEMLDLDDQRIDGGNIDPLIDALKYNISLKQIILTKNTYVTDNLDCIKHLMQHNKTIVSIAVTPPKNDPTQKKLADEIVALGQYNERYQMIGTVFRCIPDMDKLLPSVLVFLVCDYLLGTFQLNGTELLVSEIHKKESFIYPALAHRFFAPVTPSRETPVTDSKIALSTLVQKYKIKKSDYSETILELDNLGITRMEDCIAEKLRIAEKFRELFRKHFGFSDGVAGIEVTSGHLIFSSLPDSTLSLLLDTSNLKRRPKNTLENYRAISDLQRFRNENDPEMNKNNLELKQQQVSTGIAISNSSRTSFSNIGGNSHFACEHPGCGQRFEKAYTLNRHQKNHRNHRYVSNHFYPESSFSVSSTTLTIFNSTSSSNSNSVSYFSSTVTDSISSNLNSSIFSNNDDKPIISLTAAHRTKNKYFDAKSEKNRNLISMKPDSVSSLLATQGLMGSSSSSSSSISSSTGYPSMESYQN